MANDEHHESDDQRDPLDTPTNPDRRKILCNLATGVAGLGLGLSAGSASAGADKSAKEARTHPPSVRAPSPAGQHR